MLQSTSLLTILGKKVIIKKNIIQEVLLMVKNKLAVAAVFTIAFSLVQRRNRQVVKDKWNLSFLSTTAKWNSTLLPVEGVIITPTSTEDPQDNGN